MGPLSQLSPFPIEGWSKTATELIRAVAETQGGVISRQQLIDCGLSPAGIGRWVARGWLIRLHPGVYALGHAAILPHGRLTAALLHSGPGSGLAHETAAFLWKLTDDDDTESVHVVSPGRARSTDGVIVHHPRRIELVRHERFLMTSPARTLMDIAPGCSEFELRKALANADFYKRLDPNALGAVMGRGHPGSAKLRRVIKKHMPELSETLSPLEDMMLLLCERYGIPLPIPNGRLGAHRPDGLWPNAMLIVELDGGANHSSPTQRRIDAERDMHFRGLGYLVLRYTYWQVERQGASIAAEIIEAIATRSKREPSPSSIEG